MTIDSLDDFKRVMIENQYEFVEVDDDGRVAALEDVESFALTEEKGGAYHKDGRWVLLFSKRDTPLRQFGDYEDIVEEIKNNCSYVGIENYGEIDFVSYKCQESSFDGKIGFAITEGVGIIRYFPNN